MIDFTEQIKQLIRIPSISQNGNEEIALHVQDLMRKTGFKTTLQEVTHSREGVSKRQFNVIGILGDPLVDGKTKKGLLLNTHLDTVSPGILEHWTETNSDPFHAVVKGDKIYGLGSADVKLDFLCKLKACEKYKDRSLKMPIYLVGTTGEEIGMIGAQFLIKSKILNPKVVLVGEPSQLAVVYAHKAYCVYQVRLRYHELEKDAKGYNTHIYLKTFGKSAHGSFPHLGDNAILRLILEIQKIKAAHFKIRLNQITGGDSVNKVPDHACAEFYIFSNHFDEFKKFYNEKMTKDNIQIEFGSLGEMGMKFLPNDLLDAIEAIQDSFAEISSTFLTAKDKSFNPPGTTINFSKITQTPNSVDLWFDIRLLPQISLAEFDLKLKEQIAKKTSRFSGLTIKVLQNRFNPALNMRETSELVQAALQAQRAVGIAPKLDKKATSTEAAQYYAAGFDAIVFGPGESMGNSHSPNEHNIIQHLDKAVHFYEKMIERFCL